MLVSNPPVMLIKCKRLRDGIFFSSIREGDLTDPHKLCRHNLQVNIKSKSPHYYHRLNDTVAFLVGQFPHAHNFYPRLNIDIAR